MAVNGETLRKAMRLWVSGVTVVTVDDGHRMDGLTVSSFTSVTLEPPLILVCINKEWPTHDTIQRAGNFSVSFLGEGQENLCWNFASEDPDTRFEQVDYFRSPSGNPVPKGTLLYMDCQVVGSHPAGTHTVFIGEVQAVAEQDEGRPLVYYNQSFPKLAL